MNDFEIILCCILIPVGLITFYYAGKYDVLELIGQIIQYKAESMKPIKSYDEESCNEVRKSKWIYYGNDVYGCAECNGVALDYAGSPMLSNYCPNCGIAMERNAEGKVDG